MKLAEKERARLLRKQGKSLNQIIKETGFSKGSVSVWVRDIVLTNKQKKNVSERGRSIESVERRRASRLFNEEEKRRLVMDKAKADYAQITYDELKLIGIVLYLGEGSKTNKGIARVANSDTAVIKIMMRFFREVCKVPEDKFRGHIHTFAHADIKKTEKYWADIAGIPLAQLYKTYTKPSAASLQKRNTLPYGTFDISVCDTKLFLTIMGWIEKVKLLAS